MNSILKDIGVVEKNVYHALLYYHHLFSSAPPPPIPPPPPFLSGQHPPPPLVTCQPLSYFFSVPPHFCPQSTPPSFVLLPSCQPLSLLFLSHLSSVRTAPLPPLSYSPSLSASLFTVLSHLSHRSSVRPGPIPPLSYPSPGQPLSSLFCPISLLSGQHPLSFVVPLSCQPLSLFCPHRSSVRPAPIPPLSYPSPVSPLSLVLSHLSISLLSGQHPPSFVHTPLLSASLFFFCPNLSTGPLLSGQHPPSFVQPLSCQPLSLLCPHLSHLSSVRPAPSLLCPNSLLSASLFVLVPPCSLLRSFIPVFTTYNLFNSLSLPYKNTYHLITFHLLCRIISFLVGLVCSLSVRSNPSSLSLSLSLSHLSLLSLSLSLLSLSSLSLSSLSLSLTHTHTHTHTHIRVCFMHMSFYVRFILYIYNIYIYIYIYIYNIYI